MEEGSVPDLRYHASEIGKEGNYWMVTFWMTEEVTLRLRIRHYTSECEDEYTCEVKLRDARDFCTVGHFRAMTVDFSDDYCLPLETAILNLFPQTYRSAFLAMARHWAQVLQITEVAPSPVSWRNGK